MIRLFLFVGVVKAHHLLSFEFKSQHPQAFAFLRLSCIRSDLQVALDEKKK